MGLLVGLPLKLFALLFTLLRFIWPLLLAWIITRVVRHIRGGGQRAPRQEKTDEPTFKGPVYTVDYEEVEEE